MGPTPWVKSGRTALLSGLPTLQRLDHLVRDNNENRDNYWIMPLARVKVRAG